MKAFILVLALALLGYGLAVFSPLVKAEADDKMYQAVSQARAEARAEAQAQTAAIKLAEAQAASRARAEVEAQTAAILQAQAVARRETVIPYVFGGMAAGGLLTVNIVLVWLVVRRRVGSVSVERLGGGRYLVRTSDNALMSLDVRRADDRLFLAQVFEENKSCLK